MRPIKNEWTPIPDRWGYASHQVMQRACSGVFDYIGDWCCICGPWMKDCCAQARCDEEGCGPVMAALAEAFDSSRKARLERRVKMANAFKVTKEEISDELPADYVERQVARQREWGDYYAALTAPASSNGSRRKGQV